MLLPNGRPLVLQGNNRAVGIGVELHAATDEDALQQKYTARIFLEMVADFFPFTKNVVFGLFRGSKLNPIQAGGAKSLFHHLRELAKEFDWPFVVEVHPIDYCYDPFGQGRNEIALFLAKKGCEWLLFASLGMHEHCTMETSEVFQEAVRRKLLVCGVQTSEDSGLFDLGIFTPRLMLVHSTSFARVGGFSTRQWEDTEGAVSVVGSVAETPEFLYKTALIAKEFDAPTIGVRQINKRFGEAADSTELARAQANEANRTKRFTFLGESANEQITDATFFF